MMANMVRRAATRDVGGPLFLDTFTDTNGTNLTAHTPDISVGNPWVKNSPKNHTIESNAAQCPAGGDGTPWGYEIDVGAGTDYTLDVDQYNTTNESYGMMVRKSGVNFVFIQVLPVTRQIQIFTVAPGFLEVALSSINSIPILPTGAFYTVQIVVTAGAIAVSVEGSAALVWTSTQLNENFNIGLLHGTGAAIGRWDNLQVVAN